MEDDDFIPLEAGAEGQSKKRERKGPDSEYSKKTLRIYGLPETCSKELLESLFRDHGKINFAFVVDNKAKNIACTGEGFVQFASESDAKTALEKKQGYKFFGNKLKVTYARHRHRKKALLDQEDDDFTPATVQAPSVKKAHNGRLIVRNLAFNAKESDLRATFEPFGKLTEVKIVLKPDGSPRGFGFVEFTSQAEAEKAMESVNGKEICKRVIAVDLCLPKNAYVLHLGDNQKQQPQEEKKEKKPQEAKKKRTQNDVEEEKEEEEEEEIEEEEDVEEEEEEDDDDDDDDDEDEEEKPKIDLDALRAKEKGRKVFVQNLPFDATAEDVTSVFSKCGKVQRCIMVNDKNTGRPRGTCFVVYQDPESVKKCLESNAREVAEEFRFKVLGRTIFACEPMERADVLNISKKRKDMKAEYVGFDRRNIALASVGVIDQDSPQWAELSDNDKKKRQSVLTTKKQKLLNPNFVVSTVRLSVRNLPKNVDETKLKHIFASGDSSKLKQVIVLKDEVGKSKGYGFVEFKKHEYALKALQKINNNPKIFGKEQRPIVEFAIDDVRKLQLLKRKMEYGKAVGKEKEQKHLPEEKEEKRPVVERRKKTKQEKKLLREKAKRRDEIKVAKKLRRKAKRQKMEEAADDDLERQVREYAKSQGLDV